MTDPVTQVLLLLQGAREIPENPRLPLGLGELRRRWTASACARTAAIILALAGLAIATPKGLTQEDLTDPNEISSLLELADMSLQDLLEIEVTSVSKKEQSIQVSAAAVTVITNEDIRRAGVTSLPAALRLSPGLNVARVSAHHWAISARGFNDVFANKLLVMIDGRVVYHPLFSGVFWDMQDVVLEDLDRIEVVRGPGATLWGANAVNGVINIITKDARDTVGTLVATGAGTEDIAQAVVRHGEQLSDNAWIRVYGKYYRRDDARLPNKQDARDDSQGRQGGFRVDWQPEASNHLTLQGDAYRGEVGEFYQELSLADPAAPFIFRDHEMVQIGGANLLGRWTHAFSEDSDLSLLAYVDFFERNSRGFRQTRYSGNLELQHHFRWGDRQEIIYGAGYNGNADQNGNGERLKFLPPDRTLQTVNGFIQDEITILDDRLKLTLGSKFEHNDLTGFEIQPSARLAWQINDRSTLWMSVSRAVRTPSRTEHNLFFVQEARPAGPPPAAPAPTFVHFLGRESFESEELLAYEIGYRDQVSQRLTFELSGFYNVYDNLRTIEFGSPSLQPGPVPPGNLIVPVLAGNELYGETYGGEFALNFQLLEGWRLMGHYSYLQMQLHSRPGSMDDFSEESEGDSPHHQLGVRSLLNLPANVELDFGVRYVDNLPNRRVPNYLVADVRLGWRPTDRLEFSIVGQNLLDDQHLEFDDPINQVPRTEIQHAVYAKMTLRF